MAEKKDMPDLREMVKRDYGIEVVDLMDRILEIENYKNLNTVIMINSPASTNVFASISFAGIYAIDVSSGNPKFDSEKFIGMTNREKLSEINMHLNTIAGLINCIEHINKGLLDFGDTLLGMQKELNNNTQ